MAGRIPIVAIAFLVLVIMPGMASAGKIPRFIVSPKTAKALRDIFKKLAKDVPGLLPTGSPSSPGGDGAHDGGSSNAPSPPSRARHFPATSAVTYGVTFAVGSQLGFSGALDVTSEFVWVPCCTTDNSSSCGTGTHNMPGATSKVYDAPPEDLYTYESGTCQGIIPQTCNANATGDDLCAYTCTYGGGGDDGRETTTSGILAVQNFTFGDDSDAAVKGVVTFGCSSSTEGDFGASGVLGLNRGNLSLVSQLKLGRFSYYFAPEVDSPDDHNATDFIVFGDDDGITVPQTSSGSPRYTPFLTTGVVSSSYPDLYVVELTGIRVGGKDLLGGGGGGGSAGGSLEAVPSTSVPLTYLDKNAYGLLKKELMSALGSNNTEDGSALGLDLCYKSQHMDRARIPDMAFVFGGNAVMELQQWNYLYQDADTGLECLTILPLTSPDSDGLALLGSMIQTGTYMIYDLQRSRLGFQTSDPPSKPSDDPSSKPSNQTSSATAQPRGVAVVTMACFVWWLVVLNVV